MYGDIPGNEVDISSAFVPVLREIKIPHKPVTACRGFFNTIDNKKKLGRQGYCIQTISSGDRFITSG